MAERRCERANGLMTCRGEGAGRGVEEGDGGGGWGEGIGGCRMCEGEWSDDVLHRERTGRRGCGGENA